MAAPTRLRTRNWWIAIAGLLLIVVAVGGWFSRHEVHEDKAAAKPPPPVPVTVAEARTGDYPVYLLGLGTVQPFDTVTVRSRVDGQVEKVDFKQGQMLKEGDVLVQIDPRPYQAALDQAIAKKAQDEANLKNARLNLERFSTLATQNFATKQQLDSQQATVDQLTAQIKGDQAMIDNAQTQVSYTTIRSPLAGRAGFRLIDPGNIVHAADTNGIVTIVKLQPIAVVFTAPEQQVPDINKALGDGQVPVDALSSDGTKVLAHGHLLLLNNAVDQASGTISMKARYDNNDNALWPGLSVSTRLLVRTLKNATIVPQDAVQHGPDGLFVFVVGAGNKIEQHAVKVSEQDLKEAVVSEGLSPGQKVVIAGQSRIQKGTVVQPKEAKAETPLPADNSLAAAPSPAPPQRKP
ncbi:MAG TPA: efflux RND transporter periplasmic adaptor subunit [Reyranella sp.]|nr:efflux RND transporter periplasmic adaptor subunit [Reyranella sp.]